MLPSSQYEEREPLLEHLVRKSKEQPLVPLGCIATVASLYLSGRALRNRNSALANRMFYWRVASQAFTVAALVGGGYYYGEGYKREQENQAAKKRALAKERERMWIEELERIDEEAKMVKKRAEEVKRRLASEKAEAKLETAKSEVSKVLKEVKAEAKAEAKEPKTEAKGAEKK